LIHFERLCPSLFEPKRTPTSRWENKVYPHLSRIGKDIDKELVGIFEQADQTKVKRQKIDQQKSTKLPFAPWINRANTNLPQKTNKGRTSF
jgi:hypothetical protein